MVRPAQVDAGWYLYIGEKVLFTWELISMQWEEVAQERPVRFNIEMQIKQKITICDIEMRMRSKGAVSSTNINTNQM